MGGEGKWVIEKKTETGCPNTKENKYAVVSKYSTVCTFLMNNPLMYNISSYLWVPPNLAGCDLVRLGLFRRCLNVILRYDLMSFGVISDHFEKLDFLNTYILETITQKVKNDEISQRMTDQGTTLYFFWWGGFKIHKNLNFF